MVGYLIKHIVVYELLFFLVILGADSHTYTSLFTRKPLLVLPGKDLTGHINIYLHHFL